MNVVPWDNNRRAVLPSLYGTMRLHAGVVALFVASGCASQKLLPGVDRATPAYDNLDYGRQIATSLCDAQVNVQTAFRIPSGAYKEEGHVGESHWMVNYASACMFSGNYEEAEKAFVKAVQIIDYRRDPEVEKEARNTSLRRMVFRGEPYERCAAAFYCGLLRYMRGDYEGALPLFKKSVEYDGRTGDDKADYRDDFQLAYLMLGRTYLKLGESHNAEPAFRRAAIYKPYNRGPLGSEVRETQYLQRQARAWARERSEAEKRCSKHARQAKLPANQADLVDKTISDQYSPKVMEMIAKAETPSQPSFYGVDFQKEINILIVVEMGRAPVRVLQSTYGCEAGVYHAAYPERRCEVDIDGQFAGETVRIMDFWHQAKTRGEQPEAALQRTKAVGKYVGAEALSWIPFGGGIASSAFETLWDVTADPRSWYLLPGEVHAFATRVEPGRHHSASVLRLEQ